MTIGMYEARSGAARRVGCEGDRRRVRRRRPAAGDAQRPVGRRQAVYAVPFYGELDADVNARTWPTRPASRSPTSRAGTRSGTWLPRSTIRRTASTASACAASQAGATTWPSCPTLVNTFGGQWFDMKWKPQLESKPWKDAINFYVDLLKNYGPPGSSANSFNEILALTNEGKCGMWIDDDRGFLRQRPKQSKVADKMVSPRRRPWSRLKGAGWLWAWVVGDPRRLEGSMRRRSSSPGPTSKDHIRLVAKTNGWRGADRHPQVDLRQRRVPEGRAVRRRREARSTAPIPNDSTPARRPMSACSSPPSRVPGHRRGGGPADRAALAVARPRSTPRQGRRPPPSAR